jgi:hypothetical protein
MTKTLENFIKNLKKLDNYFILQEESEYFILGTEIIIKEHKEILGNVFQPFSKNVERKLPVFFLLNIDKPHAYEINKQFTKNDLPILNWDLKTNNKDIQSILDQFVKNWI